MTTSDQLPAIIEPTATTALTTLTGTYIVPALITDAGGEQAGWRYVEFFSNAEILLEETSKPLRCK